MSMFRAAFLSLLVIALLPWGTWIHAARAAEAAPYRVAAPERAEPRQTISPRSASTLSRCQMATGLPLPGCSLFTAAPGGAGLPGSPDAAQPRPAAGTRMGALHDPAGPFIPPRRS
ncbi:hypothetical protein [Mangrovicoccus algicola]|uniref:Uncharacterized protein n=1 Tax=Mangrovicoccus algicola TaxID=2771008 RepID=A0A8J6YWW3_9RHOB|nr:hypothetical protein [Mangrovicoccus algicola]MBE3637759.1 hypothetical protein [Mangrovicoccus algicola]